MFDGYGNILRGNDVRRSVELDKEEKMVSHIAWDDAYKVNNDMIDSQHQKLFQLADGLYGLVSSGEKDRNKVGKVIQELVEYVMFHFGSEEELMKKIGYADADSHISAHRAFNDYTSKLVGDFSAGKEVDLGELYTYIGKWLVDHITVVDKKLAASA